MMIRPPGGPRDRTRRRVITLGVTLLGATAACSRERSNALSADGTIELTQVDVGEAERQTLEFLGTWIPRGVSPLCGNSISQDRRFLRREMPLLDAFFHYRQIDVSTVKELTRRWYSDRYQPPAKREVHRAIDDEHTVIVDVRRESEYRGSEKRARRAGTIPGAVHVFWREHLDGDGALRPAAEVRALYASRGVTPDKTVIPLCQGGYRSASTFLALKSLGYPRVRNYVGSWGEWGNRDDSKIVVPGQ